MLIDGVVTCPSTAGIVKFDTLMNGSKIYPTRTIQTAQQGTSTLSHNWPISCANCVQGTDSDGNATYTNTLQFTFNWDPPSVTTNTVPPNVEAISYSVIAVA